MSQKYLNTPYIKALWLSIALHAVMIAVLFIGDFSSKPKERPAPSIQEMQPIQAVAVDKAKLDKAINKIKKQKSDALAAEKKRIENIERRAAEAKKRRAKEEARIKRLEKQRKQKEQEKIKADNAAKSAKAKAAKAEKLRKQKEQEKKKAEDAAAKARSKRIKEEAAAKKAEELRRKKKAEAEAKRKKELAEKKRKEAEAKERAKQEEMLAQQMAAEMASRNKARRQQVLSEIDRFAALIKQSINRNMIKDRSTMAGKTCKLTISLAPSGFVTQVVIGQGDRVVCEAAKTAIYKAGTLPVSKDPEVFKEMRKIAVTVVPEF
ncbi:cell envelope integrity protein TolA [Litorilituus lipolyticus]|nr:cell envelope integrity protein TolA [Litorilituus lipolyticus]